jgi:carbamoyl-phosphate synthase large subunit
MKNILVTGCSSLVGQGIIKTILSSKKKYEVFGTEYIKGTVGEHWVKKAYILPDVLKQNFSINAWLLKIIKIIKSNKIDYLIPGLDFELLILNKIKFLIENKTQCKIIISDKRVIDICSDKWKTNKFLKENNFIYPNSCLPKDLKSFLKKNKYPFIVKPRTSSRSRNIFFVKNKKELTLALQKCPRPIIQEYLFEKNNEFTCGVVIDPKINECLSSIVLRRDLKNGNTAKASFVKNKKNLIIEKFIIEVAKKLKPYGPLNFQLCLTKKGPMIFEINPRFSGTTPLRNIFGVNEISILLNCLENKKVNKIKLKEGTIYRYLSNYFVKKK